jgi:hypothetical protein
LTFSVCHGLTRAVIFISKIIRLAQLSRKPESRRRRKRRTWEGSMEETEQTEIRVLFKG